MTPLEARIARIRHVVMDMDGTIYEGKRLFPTTHPFLERLRSLGIEFSFLTNNSSRGVCEYLEHLRGFGILIARERMLTSTRATVDFLRSRHPDVNTLFMLGTPAFRREMNAEYKFRDAALDEEPDAVVTAFDTGLTYERLCKAAWWIKKGKLWIATHPDLECPTELETTLVDCGSISACLSAVSGRAPVVPGKPMPEMLKPVMNEFGLEPDEIAMCGDRMYTDIRLAANSGAFGVLVSDRPHSEIKDNIADITVRDLEEFGEMLSGAKAHSAEK